jgi:hypothetical protein
MDTPAVDTAATGAAAGALVVINVAGAVSVVVADGPVVSPRAVTTGAATPAAASSIVRRETRRSLARVSVVSIPFAMKADQRPSHAICT